MRSKKAKQILVSHGYELSPIPEGLYRPGYSFIVEPDDVHINFISDADMVRLAEAIQKNHRCYVCQEQARSRCPHCKRWTCRGCRRDYGPPFNDHMCEACLTAYSVAAWEAQALKEEYGG